MRDSQRTTMLVDEARAAALLGVSANELRRLSAQAGVGQPALVVEPVSEEGLDPASEAGIRSDHRVFTYTDLYRLCRVAVQSAR